MTFVTPNELLHEIAARYPEKVFLFWSDKNRLLTYGEAAQMSGQVAGVLAELGVKKGDRVALLAHNGLDYVLAMLGAWKLGAISTHIDVRSATSLAAYLQDCQPKVLVYTGDKHNDVERARAEVPGVEHCICFDGVMPGSYDWTDLLLSAPTIPEVAITEHESAYLGYPMNGSASRNRLLFTHGFLAEASRSVCKNLDLSSSDISLSPVPLASLKHLITNLLPGIYHSMTVGLMTKWEIEFAWQEIVSRNVSLLVSNLGQLTEILQLSRSRSIKPAFFRIGLSIDGPVPPDLKRAYLDELGVFLHESHNHNELRGSVAAEQPY